MYKHSFINEKYYFRIFVTFKIVSNVWKLMASPGKTVNRFGKYLRKLSDIPLKRLFKALIRLETKAKT